MADETADETEAPPLATLRIGVYRVNVETGEKTVIKPTQVIEATTPLVDHNFPLCSAAAVPRSGDEEASHRGDRGALPPVSRVSAGEIFCHTRRVN